MISVLTLTYQRHELLEEAIESFLRQDVQGCEMVVINDYPDVKYHIGNKNIRIINVDKRLSSVGKKLEFGYQLCKYPFIYRLDDDDLLAPNGLETVVKAIAEVPMYDIYRSKGHYYFCHNDYHGIHDSINNGNCYSKNYLNKIKFPEKSGDEDISLTFENNGTIYTIDKPTMIYRWGMNTYHISGMGINPTDIILSNTDKLINKEEGIIELKPHFKEDYYLKLK